MPPEDTCERLVLTMEEPLQQSGLFPLAAFVSAFHALQRLMREVAEEQTGIKHGGIECYLSGLSHSSPITAGIIPFVNKERVAKHAVVGAEKALALVADGQADDVPIRQYQAIGQIITSFNKWGVPSAKIQRRNGAAGSGYRPVVVDKNYSDIYSLRGLEENLRDTTTISGTVEAVDLRASPVRLRIHPKIGEPVNLRLSGDAREIAKSAIGKRVFVSGVAYYRPDAERFLRPYRIDAKSEQVEVFDGKNARSLKEFRGAFPDLTDGKDTVQYLRELRGDDD